MGPLSVSTFIKYFEPADSFIKVRSSPEDITRILATTIESNPIDRTAYQAALASASIPELNEVILAVRKRDPHVEREEIEARLYDVITTVHPAFEINQVTLPSQTNPLADAFFTRTGGASQQFHDRLRTLEQALLENVYGQEKAIRTLSEILLAEGTVRLEPGPLCALLFVGPTGVGKTEVAKVMAKHLFGDNRNSLLRVNCSEYGLPHEVAKLIGSPAGYVGHNEGGYLSEGLKKQSQRVVLFDELEKAHSKVFDFLLPYTDEGEFVDAKGERIDGRQSAIVMTSNLGSDRLERARSGGIGFSRGGAQAINDQLIDLIRPALRESFRPEFIGRLKIIPFRGFDSSDYRNVMQLLLEKSERRLAEAGYTIEFAPNLVSRLVADSYEPQYGARELKGHLHTELLDPLRLWIGRNRLQPNERTRYRLFVSDDQLSIGEISKRGRTLVNVQVLSTHFRSLANSAPQNKSERGDP